MTNKRAKPDSGITMDDVDGFSAAELFGQGASSSPSPPPPPTDPRAFERPEFSLVPTPLVAALSVRSGPVPFESSSRPFAPARPASARVSS
jgi:hypothetical protein